MGVVDFAVESRRPVRLPQSNVGMPSGTDYPYPIESGPRENGSGSRSAGDLSRAVTAGLAGCVSHSSPTQLVYSGSMAEMEGRHAVPSTLRTQFYVFGFVFCPSPSFFSPRY